MDVLRLLGAVAVLVYTYLKGQVAPKESATMLWPQVRGY